jgi:hypothetical protein
MKRNNIALLQQELNMYILAGNDEALERIQLLIDKELNRIGKEKEENEEGSTDSGTLR